uniref:Putative LuxR-type DNA-binding HTH domain containing protein n=1 Tax=viral metagenome TaxID=1070528 RepID=A0A6H1ZNI9_9ZZZZ
MSEIQLQTRNNLYGFDYLEPDNRRRNDQYNLGEEEESKPLKYEIKQLWQRSHEIVNLSATGYKNKEIAQILNISPVTVSNTLNGKLGQHKLSEVRQDRDIEAKKTVEKIRVLTNKALNVYHEIFDNESGQATLRDQKSVADTVVLELSGLRVPTKVQSHSVYTNLTRDEIEAFKQRGIKAAQIFTPIIDVDEESDKDE